MFDLLDSLEELAEKNNKTNSKLFETLSHVYDSVKHTGGKIFIFQANEAVVGENFLN